MTSGSWQGVYMPVGTPRPIINKLFAVFTKVMGDPGTVKRLNENGVEVVTNKSPEEFAVFMKNENEKWARLVKEVGVVLE